MEISEKIGKTVDSKEDTWLTLSIGSDESGKGDWFGGPTITAVKLDKKTLDKLKKEKYFRSIKDSKRCTDNWINEHAPKLMKICEHKYVTLTATEYNKLYKKYENINRLLAVLHNKTQISLKQTNNMKRVIDAFVKYKSYYSHLSESGIYNENVAKIDDFCIKGDSKYLSVAIASIISRYKYIQQIKELSETTGVNIPYGNKYSSDDSVVETYKKLRAKGYTDKQIDEDFTKSNFVTFKKVKAILINYKGPN